MFLDARPHCKMLGHTTRCSAVLLASTSAWKVAKVFHQVRIYRWPFGVAVPFFSFLGCCRILTDACNEASRLFWMLGCYSDCSGMGFFGMIQTWLAIFWWLRCGSNRAVAVSCIWRLRMWQWFCPIKVKLKIDKFVRYFRFFVRLFVFFCFVLFVFFSTLLGYCFFFSILKDSWG